MKFVSGMIIVGLICAYFWGVPGFLIGGLVGALLIPLGGKSETKKNESRSKGTSSENKSNAVVPAVPVVIPGVIPSKGVMEKKSKDYHWGQPTGVVSTQNALITVEHSSRTDSRERTSDLRTDPDYTRLLVSCIGLSVMADGLVDENELALVRGVLARDEMIVDKEKAMSLIEWEVDGLKLAIQGSALAFGNRMDETSEALRKLKSQKKIDRLWIALHALNSSIRACPNTPAEAVLTRLLSCLKSPTCQFAGRFDEGREMRMELVDRYLRAKGELNMSSAFRAAVATGKGRARLMNEARGSSMLRTALGVFAGVVAADIVRAALANGELNRLSEVVDMNMETGAGLDLLAREGLDVTALTEEPLNDSGKDLWVESDDSFSMESDEEDKEDDEDDQFDSMNKAGGSDGSDSIDISDEPIDSDVREFSDRSSGSVEFDD
jgi:hypothetical protein